jgi:hypothetical protein
MPFTIVLVAALRLNHEHHERRLKRVEEAGQEHSACAIHALAEFYATLSELPAEPILHAEQVLLSVPPRAPA